MAGEAEQKAEEEVEGVQRQEVGEAELEAFDEYLDQIFEFVQCVCWACRSIYVDEAKWISAFKKLQENLQKEACVFKQGLLPLTLTVISGLSTFLYNEYLDIELNVWRKRLDKVVEGAVEQSKLFWCLAEYYRYLSSEVRSHTASAKEILDTVLFEARDFEKTRKILHVKSNVREEIWLPLLFVPYVGCFATQWAVKNEDSSVSKRIAAKSEGEKAVAAAWCHTDSLAPALLRVAGALDGIAAFFSMLLPPLEVLSTAENKEDPAWLEKTEAQLQMVKEKAFRMQMRCLDLVGLQSSLEFQLEPVPNMSDEVVDDYVKQWLDTKLAPAELQLVVSIVSARGLPAADAEDGALPSFGGADPYCVCRIPSKKRSTIKTRVIRDNCNPVWNFEANLPDYSAGDDIEFLVYDKDYGKADDLLATCLLEGPKFYPGGFTGDVQLKVCFGTSDKATLRLKLKIVDAKEAGDQAVGVPLADKMRDATENTEVVWALEP